MEYLGNRSGITVNLIKLLSKAVTLQLVATH